MRTLHKRTSGANRWCCGLVVAALLAGCGVKQYEERLASTSNMFAYMQLLDDNLAPPWTDFGITIRVPRQFGLIPPPQRPARKKDDDNEPPEEVIDDRQPDYINVELPGLVGAFQAPLETVGEDNTVATHPGFIYVLCNQYVRPGSKLDPAKAATFTNDFLDRLTAALHVSIDHRDPSKWRNETFPVKREPFLKLVDLKVLELKSEDLIHDVPTQFAIYQYELEGAQVLIMTVLPETTSPSERLTERVPLALGTLVVNVANMVQGSGGAAPAAGGASF